jgi:hypothetical protein
LLPKAIWGTILQYTVKLTLKAPYTSPKEPWNEIHSHVDP